MRVLAALIALQLCIGARGFGVVTTPLAATDKDCSADTFQDLAMRTTVACCAKGSCTMSRGDMFPASCSVSCAAEFVSNLYLRCRNSLRVYTVQRAGASAKYMGYHFFQKCLANDFGSIKSALASANRGQCGGTGGSAVPAGTHQPAVDPVVPTGHRLLGGSGAITNNAKGKRFMLLAISKKCGSATKGAAAKCVDSRGWQDSYGTCQAYRQEGW